MIRMPPEWETHEATWIAWPHNASDWPGKLAAIHWVYAEIVRKIAPGEIVRIIVNSKSHEAAARKYLGKAGVPLDRVEFFPFPTDRGWTRDFGPIFVRNGKDTAIVDFAFNGWARYSNWKMDNRIPGKVASALGKKLLPVRYNGKPVVLEGGAVDVNGGGILLATEECLLDQVTQTRNPGLSRWEMEMILVENLGIELVVWLGKGIAGDDTHGHVDDVARFVGPSTVVLCEETDPTDANFRALVENRDRLKNAGLGIVLLPMPGPLYFEGIRLPASYANFYVANSAVLVPTFNDPNDRVALEILSDCFPDRPVVGIHSVDLAWGFGTLHCLTQQQPA
jgi:agmatine deiminase